MDHTTSRAGAECARAPAVSAMDPRPTYTWDSHLGKQDPANSFLACHFAALFAGARCGHILCWAGDAVRLCRSLSIQEARCWRGVVLRGILSPECPENQINILVDMQDAKRRTLFSRSSPLRQNRLPLRFQLWPNLRHATQESFGVQFGVGT